MANLASCGGGGVASTLYQNKVIAELMSLIRRVLKQH